MSHRDDLVALEKLSKDIHSFTASLEKSTNKEKLTELTGVLAEAVSKIEGALEELELPKVAGVTEDSTEYDRWVAGDYKFYRSNS